MWVRGLKLALSSWSLSENTSHPMWVRGLKHNFQHFLWFK